MAPLDLVKLTPLMAHTSGKPEIVVGLVDGPVAMNHADLAASNMRQIPGKITGTCTKDNSTACLHGTLVAGILCGKRHSIAPGICPNCTVLVRPLFAEMTLRDLYVPSATPQDLAAAIIECTEAGARVINLSLALAQPSSKDECELEQVLDYAVKRGVIIVAAAGNQGMLGSTVITRHTGVIPVVAYDLQARPMNHSNLGCSIGRRGLGAPGEAVTSLGTDGKPLTFGGTSVATPFVTGAIALLWSIFPMATAADLRFAVTQAYASKRARVVPPLLDAWGAYLFLTTAQATR